MAPPMAVSVLVRCPSFIGDCEAIQDPHFQRQMQQYACRTASLSSDYLPADVHKQNCEQFPDSQPLILRIASILRFFLWAPN